MEFWESLFVHDFKMIVSQADDTEYIYLASLHRDSMLHTQRHARHAISPKTHIFSKEKTQSRWSTDTQLIHSCMQSQVHSRYPREILGNRKWQWTEEAVPKRRKIPSDLCHSEEGMREERGLDIYYNERKGQQSIRYSLNKKKERANCERFKSFLYTGIVLQLVDGFEILSFSSQICSHERKT